MVVREDNKLVSTLDNFLYSIFKVKITEVYLSISEISMSIRNTTKFWFSKQKTHVWIVVPEFCIMTSTFLQLYLPFTFFINVLISAQTKMLVAFDLSFICVEPQLELSLFGIANALMFFLTVQKHLLMNSGRTTKISIECTTLINVKTIATSASRFAEPYAANSLLHFHITNPSPYFTEIAK